jgi:hypothetical protein
MGAPVIKVFGGPTFPPLGCIDPWANPVVIINAPGWTVPLARVGSLNAGTARKDRSGNLLLLSF